MTIGQLFIMLAGFSAGVIAAFIIAMHTIDEARADARYWRNEAIKAGRK